MFGRTDPVGKLEIHLMPMHYILKTCIFIFKILFYLPNVGHQSWSGYCFLFNSCTFFQNAAAFTGKIQQLIC